MAVLLAAISLSTPSFSQTGIRINAPPIAREGLFKENFHNLREFPSQASKQQRTKAQNAQIRTSSLQNHKD